MVFGAYADSTDPIRLIRTFAVHIQYHYIVKSTNIDILLECAASLTDLDLLYSYNPEDHYFMPRLIDVAGILS